MKIWERVTTCHVHKQWAWVWRPVWGVAPGHWITWPLLLFLLQLFKHSEAIPSKYELEQSWKTMLRSGKCYCRSGADTLCAYTGLWSLSSTVKLSAQFILFLTIACAHTYRAEYIIVHLCFKLVQSESIVSQTGLCFTEMFSFQKWE